tara:strand:+ start:679 stop:825 length:147 start_codon:yes stop_codon:yes gene_type:complete
MTIKETHPKRTIPIDRIGTTLIKIFTFSIIILPISPPSPKKAIALLKE